MKDRKWIDVSAPLFNGMVHWPGDEPFHRQEMMSLEAGDVCNLSKIGATVHIGTHMDAPRHFVEGGASMDEMPLDATMGRARVIAIENPEIIPVDELEGQEVSPGERVLFRTRNSVEAWTTPEFRKNFVYIPEETAKYLASRRVRTVGVDYLSVGAFNGDGPQAHRALLSAGIWIIEGLQLGEVEPGEYDLICLPLRLVGSEGAPARAVLRARRP